MLAHERLEAWKLCHELVLAVYAATASFPKHELYGLTSAELAYVFRLVRDLKLLADDDCTRLEALRGRAGFMTWRLYRAVTRAVKPS